MKMVPLYSMFLFPWLVCPALGESKAWTLDAIMELKQVSDPQISADGTKVAYVVRSVNWGRNAYDSEISVMTVADGRSQRLGHAHFSDSRPRWSSDSKRLAFLSSREEGITQIFVVDEWEREPRQLTNSPTAVTYFKWSPNGEQIGYLTTDPLTLEEVEAKQAKDDPIVADRNYKYARLYVVPSQGGRPALLTRQDRHIISFEWSPDGSKIVYSGQTTPRSRDSFNVDLYEVDLASGRDMPLVMQEGRDAEPAYSPDGQIVAFHSQGGTLNYFAARHVGLVPSGGGPIRYITERFEGDVFRGGNEFWWRRDGSELVFGAGKGTKDYLYLYRLKDEIFSILIESLDGPSSFSVSRDGGRIAFLKSSRSDTTQVYLHTSSDNPTERRLSNVNPGLREYPPMKTKTITWKSKDDLAIDGVLRLPFNYKEGERVPLLVELHGGPTGVALQGFPIPRYYPTQLFAQQGFAVLAPNFRGSSNYGAKFRLANIKSQGFGDMNDVMTGIDLLIEQGIADPDRLGIMGWSYGGFLTTWIIGHTNRFKAASIGATASDWISWYGATDGPLEPLWTYFGGKPWDTWEVYNRHSPRFSLMNAKTPSLLVHGALDIDTTSEVYHALIDLQVPVEFVTYPREGHGIQEPMHQRDLLRRNLEWFKKWLR